MSGAPSSAPTAGKVLHTAKALLRKGLVEGTAGNLSARRPDGLIVTTPSAVDYEAMTLDDLLVVDLDGNVVEPAAAPGRSPTSELHLHLACYRAYDDVQAVIHAHPVWATMFASARQALPACIDEFAMYVGGDVRCAEYGQSGSEALAANAVAALEGRGAALLANHGLVAVGPSPAKVLHIVALVERVAQIAWGARALGGPVALPEQAQTDFAGVYEIMRALP
ncbi:L-fuculose-phosphate aldolase [Acidimicrobiaceae bacterium USS-CC1]|uniref:L-fuculose-phosphate aldolase n=1 Tax=Acidiferrimicrobium australe TaxID=2664430 RepID=A0ABW9QV60_9ACTN|nr:L-fuculose-phosphate aldolase [Acidiferrimicrobium australe]